MRLINYIALLLIFTFLIGCSKTNKVVIYAVEEFEEPFEGCNSGICSFPENIVSIMEKCLDKGFDGVSAFSTAKPMKFTCVKLMRETYFDEHYNFVKDIPYFETTGNVITK